MKATQVETTCISLTPVFKLLIRREILQLNIMPEQYSIAQALLFFIVDFISKQRILSTEQQLLLLEVYEFQISDFGQALEEALDKVVKDDKSRIELPTCKIGILDNRYICIDRSNKIIDLETGKIIEDKEFLQSLSPIKTTIINLTSLFQQYKRYIRE